MALIDEVKSLGRITTSDDDDILQHYIDILTNEALNYTQRDELTRQLELLIISYTLKWYNGDIINDVKNVSSIKRGDTQTTFNVNDSDLQMELLNSFRDALSSLKLIRAVI